MDPSVDQQHQDALTQEVTMCMLCSGPTVVEKTRGGRSSITVPQFDIRWKAC